jgi:hypothetical protein
LDGHTNQSKIPGFLTCQAFWHPELSGIPSFLVSRAGEVLQKMLLLHYPMLRSTGNRPTI